MSAVPVQRRSAKRLAPVLSLVFHQSCQESGLSELALSEVLGVNRKTVRRWRSQREAATPTLEALSRMPADGLRVVLEALAASIGCGLTDLPGSAEPGTDLDRLSAHLRESGELTAAYAEAIQDGHVSAHEAEVLEREALDVERTARAIRAWCAAIKRERVMGVRV